MSPVAAAELMVLLWLLVAVVVHVRVATGGFWYKAKILTSKLDLGTSTSQQLKTKLLCAAKASQTDWCFLFVYNNGTCTLSDVYIEADQDDSRLGNTTHVWTRIKAGKSI